jgi:hypothetical protein
MLRFSVTDVKGVALSEEKTISEYSHLLDPKVMKEVLSHPQAAAVHIKRDDVEFKYDLHSRVLGVVNN